MARHLIEYLGPKGIVTTLDTFIRRGSPKAGDFILWPNGRIGRLERPSNPRLASFRQGDWSACAEVGSAFLDLDKDRRPTVEISGGPFLTVNAADLKPIGLHTGEFWNWGDHFAGAHQGVRYDIQRPLYAYRAPSTHWAITVAPPVTTPTALVPEVVDPAESREDRIKRRSGEIRGLLLDQSTLMLPELCAVIAEFVEYWGDPWPEVDNALTCGEFRSLVELFEATRQGAAAAAWVELHETHSGCSCD